MTDRGAVDEVVLTAKVLRWGNSYGLRIRKADLERAGLKPGEEAVVRLERPAEKIDLSHIRTFHSGRTDTAERHDEVVGAAAWEDLRRTYAAWDARHGPGKAGEEE